MTEYENNVVEATEVTKTFGDVKAVNRLSFSVPAGTIYGFIGPNGSGKTTTLRMIMNILHPDLAAGCRASGPGAVHSCCCLGGKPGFQSRDFDAGKPATHFEPDPLGDSRLTEVPLRTTKPFAVG